MDWLWTAIGAAIVPVGLIVGGMVRARKAVANGAVQAQTDLIATLQGLNSALVEENSRLRTDLAGCESDNRALRRALPRD